MKERLGGTYEPAFSTQGDDQWRRPEPKKWEAEGEISSRTDGTIIPPSRTELQGSKFSVIEVQEEVVEVENQKEQ